MTSLVEKYRPRTIGDFAGMDRVRSILNHFIDQPWESAWLLLGPSGLGKTTMALALAEQIGGDVHHIPSRRCDMQTVESIVHTCWYVPMSGKWHVVLVDEADQMSRAAQLAFLSKLDTTARPPQTIFIFTANDTRLLEDRFLSRCRTLKFETADLLQPVAELLARIWKTETPAPLPRAEYFRKLVESANLNVRQAIMDLELDLIAGGPCVTKSAPETVPAAGRIDAEALAGMLGINQATVYNWVKRGKLPPPDRNGRSMTWNPADIPASARAA